MNGPAQYAAQQEAQQRQNFQNILNMLLAYKQQQYERDMAERARADRLSQEMWNRQFSERELGARESERAAIEKRAEREQSFREKQAMRPTQDEEMYSRVDATMGGLRGMGVNVPPGVTGQKIREMKGQKTWAESEAEAKADHARRLAEIAASGEQQRKTWGTRDESKADPMTKARIDAINKTLATYSTQKNTLETAKSKISPYDPKRVASAADLDKKIAQIEEMEKVLIAKRDTLLYPNLDARVQEFISQHPEYTPEEAESIFREYTNSPKK